MTFLPSLRPTAHKSAPSTEVARAYRQSETKIILESYYAALAAAGLGPGNEGSKPWPIERAIQEGYDRVVYVFKAVEAIAGSTSRLTFALAEDDKKKKVVQDHPTARVLNGQANPLETGRQFKKRLSGQAMLSKRGAFVEMTQTRRGDLVRVDLLPPGRTRPVPGKGADLISHYEVKSRDGIRVRNLDVEKVKWIREPHLTDPFSGVTPLESMGLSIELDHFARLFNASFMRNDGRPGGILGVEADTDDIDMERIESKFGKGPVEAGKLTVVGGKLDYVDTAATPRDAQYVQSSSVSKVEILTGFGVPESIIGNASGRTFANADAEAEAFWLLTMLPHLEMLASAFAVDGLDPFFDVSAIEALNRAIAKRREEAREEQDAGLRTINEYREAAGLDPIDSPEARALWLPTGRIPIATKPEDAEALKPYLQQALGGAPNAGTASAAAGGDSQPVQVGPGGPAAAPAGAAGNQPPAPLPAGPSTGAPPPAPVAATATDAGSSTDAPTGGNEAKAALLPVPPGHVPCACCRQTGEHENGGECYRCDASGSVTHIDANEPNCANHPDNEPAATAAETKALPFDADHPDIRQVCLGCGDVVLWDDTDGWQREDGSVGHGDEGDVGDTHSDVMEPPAGLVLVKAKEGTAAPVDEDERARDRLEVAIGDALTALVVRQAEVAVARVGSPKQRKGTRHWEPEMEGDTRFDASKGLEVKGIIDAGRWRSEAEKIALGLIAPVADAAAERVLAEFGEQGEKAAALSRMSRLARASTNGVVKMVGDSAARQAAMLQQVIAGLDNGNASAADIAAAIREYGDKQKRWATGVAVQAATAGVEGARDAVLSLVATKIVRRWVTRRDDDVRKTHRKADGQYVPPGKPFKVGGHSLRFPGDPDAPVKETANCRCRVRLLRAADARVGDESASVPEPVDDEAKVRHVASPEGERRYGLPEGTPLDGSHRKPGAPHVGGGGASAPAGGSGTVVAEPAAFKAGFDAAFPADSPFKAFVSHYSLDETAKMTPLLANDGKTGLLVKDHGDGRIEATALFNNGGGRGAGIALLKESIAKHGVNYVECFGPTLPEMYAGLGFKPSDGAPYDFDPAEAPEGWNYDLHNHPAYYVMRLADEARAASSTNED